MNSTRSATLIVVPFFILHHLFKYNLLFKFLAPSSGEGSPIEFLELVLQKRKVLGFMSTNDGELAAFISYAQAFPRGLLALVDTYDTVQRYDSTLCYHTLSIVHDN